VEEFDFNTKWYELVEKVKAEWASFEKVLKEDEDLEAVRETKAKLGEDLRRGLSERVLNVLNRRLRR
jgi:hypothetical protein